MRIEELKARVPLERLLEHYHAEVPLVAYGNAWVSMKCPWHDDSTASASVNLVEGRFACHACDVQGDVLDIVQQVGLASDVREAKQWIADHFMDGAAVDESYDFDSSECPTCGDEGWIPRNGRLEPCTTCSVNP